MDNATQKQIWDTLMEDIKNPYGVAGVMGNLMSESSMNPICITGYAGVTAAEYVANIKDGKMSLDQFIHDSVAFGLAQWRYWSRKESLIHFTGINRIDDPIAQIRYLLWEIKTYKAVWDTLINAKSVQEASDVVMLKYEKPANTSDAIKQKRANYGQQFYDKFANPTPAPTKKYVRTTTDKVFLRRGNDKSYTSITRINKAGQTFQWVATSDNGWHAVKYTNPDMVGWISGEFSEVVSV